MSSLTSIIMTAYIQNRAQCHMTMAAIANITRYTNTDEYELILMSDSEKFPVRDDYHLLKIDKYIRTEGESYTQAMNHGAKEAKGKYLVFIHNDVFVWESWLPDLRDYLEMELTDCIIPDQVPRERDFVLASYGMNTVEGMQFGSRDEGLLMITRKAFDKTGGFDENLTMLQAGTFYKRMKDVGVRQNDTCKVMITHIMAATNLDRLDTKPEEYETMMQHDRKVLTNEN